MKTAIFADIHSNYIALEHCTEYAISQGIETFLFLGDYIGEMAYPERTMKLLYAMPRFYSVLWSFATRTPVPATGRIFPKNIGKKP